MDVRMYIDKRWSILGKANLDNVFMLIEGEVNTEVSADPEDQTDNFPVLTDRGR